MFRNNLLNNLIILSVIIVLVALLLPADSALMAQTGGDISIKPPIPVVRTLGQLVSRINKYFFPVALAFSGLVFLIGSGLYMSSAGDVDRKTKAKKTLWWSALGLVIFLLAKAIANALQNILPQ